MELDKDSTTEDFLLVRKEGNREVNRKLKYYNLDAVISVDYRVNADRAIQFRRCATNVFKDVGNVSQTIACDKALCEA